MTSKTTAKAAILEPLLYATSNQNADLRWFTTFDCCDPFLAFGCKGKRFGLTHRLEFGRMQTESRLDFVLLWDTVEQEIKKKNPKKARVGLVDIILYLQKKMGIAGWRVPRDFPVFLFQQMREKRVRIEIASGPMFPERAIKTKEEVKLLTEANRVTALAHKRVRKIFTEAVVGPKNMLKWNGKTLTSEILRREIDLSCVAHGSVPVLSNIAAPGDQAVDNHFVGSGPIPAHAFVVVDIFPRMAASGYYGDITRTYMKGKASPEQRKHYNTVRKGQQIAFSKIKDGVCASVPFKAVQEFFIAQGFPPGEKNGRSEGFRHGLGHGLGLDVHEAPNMGSVAQELKAGQVITVEPGLYYLGRGGVRIEDVVLVTKTGCELLSHLPYSFEI